MPDTHNKQLPASPSCSDEDNFGLLLHFVRQGLIRHLEQALAAQDLGLSFTQYRVLKMLTNVPHLGASELARRLEHDAGALTRLLDTLEPGGPKGAVPVVSGRPPFGRDFAHRRRPRAVTALARRLRTTY